MGRGLKKPDTEKVKEIPPDVKFLLEHFVNFAKVEERVNNQNDRINELGEWIDGVSDDLDERINRVNKRLDERVNRLWKIWSTIISIIMSVIVLITLSGVKILF